MDICLKTVRNDDGSAIIFILIILMGLTIIGISATSTTDVELNITSSDRLYRIAFYSAESGIFSTAKRISYILDENEVPSPAGPGEDGLKYTDSTDDELYDEVLGQKDAAGNPSYDAAPDINFEMTRGGAAAAGQGGGTHVALPGAAVEVDLKNLGAFQPAGEASEFGTGADALGSKAIVVIPYALASDGRSVAGAKAKVRSVYFKYKNKPGGI